MGDECDCGSKESCEKLVFRRELGSRTIGKKPSNWYADEGMERVPDEIERRNLVGEEFDDEQGRADADDGPSCKKLEPGWEWKMTEAGEESEDCDGGVEVEPRGESYGHKESEKLSGWNFQDVEHRSDCSKLLFLYYGALRRSAEQSRETEWVQILKEIPTSPKDRDNTGRSGDPKLESIGIKK